MHKYNLNSLVENSNDEKIMLEQIMEFNRTFVQYAKEKTLNELFEEQVRNSPEKIALVFEDKCLTYKELNTKSNSLAIKLRELGVKNNTIVGIMVLPSFEMIIGIIAILKAGGAYLPIDPKYPPDRIKFMLEDSKSEVLLTNVKHEFSFSKKIHIIDLDDKSLYCNCEVDLPILNKSTDLAYIIYTSGSTGKPKGVMIEHKAVINFVKGMMTSLDFPLNCVMLAVTTMSFDISVVEMILPLLNSYKIVIATEKQRSNPNSLCKLILDTNVNSLQVTPSRLQLMLMNKNFVACLQKLDILMVGGEEFSDGLLERLRSMTIAKIYNLYGPTETTIWSTVCYLSDIDVQKVNIGRPISNTQVFIVNDDNLLLPVGIEGEICIAGDGLARGYLNNPGLTSDRFVLAPFSQNLVMYKTGDIGRWLANGCIEFLGRKDDQIKIRGYRIELGEIESTFLKSDIVKMVAVVAKERKDASKYLCAFIVLNKDTSENQLRSYLSKYLPDFMVPEKFVFLDHMPLTPSGKVDKKLLRDVCVLNDQNNFKELCLNSINEKYNLEQIELKVRLIISENSSKLATVEDIGINESLKTCGIDSITFVKILVCIEKEYDFVFDDEYLGFDNLRTINGIVSYINSKMLDKFS